MLFSFVTCLFAFLVIGLLSARFKRNTRSDYYLASSAVPPWLVGLSAMATNNSGYMFIGLIGYTYVTGLSSLWLMFGWILGDMLASFVIYKPLHRQTGQQNQLSYAGVLSRWGGVYYRKVQVLAAILIVCLLTTYASAQMIAGSKALLAMFNWPIATGAVISAIMIALYCFAGGIRASIWTDAAQSMVMILAMIIMCWVGVSNLGGVAATFGKLQQIEHYLDWFPADNLLPGLSGAVLFITGWLFAGICVIGQPHIMVRFMALDDAANFTRARIWYYSWYTLFYTFAAGVGLLSRLLVPEQGTFDAELALPLIALELLPPIMVGLVLAGLFAATMSTADSLILSASATVTQDFVKEGIKKLSLVKFTTLCITLLALLIALSGNQNVFSLVLFAWSGLGACFGPLLIVFALGKKPDQKTALTMMLSGAIIVVLWRQWNLHHYIFEGMPGILGGLLVYCVMSNFQEKKSV